jgi:hypothetical protein
MGNNSNTQTLRPNLFSNINSTNLKISLHNLEILKNLRRSFLKKQVFLVDYFVSNNLNTLEFHLFIFFRTRKLVSYKKTVLKPGFKKNNLYFSKLLNCFTNIKLKKFNIKIFVLNKLKTLRYKNKKLVIQMYKKFKSFKLKLFNKNFNLFFDFIKISSLFLVKKIQVSAVLYTLSLIFCFLRKRSHSTFLFFLKTYFSFLLLAQKQTFSGFKFLIFGKISGKSRASFKRIQVGSVSVQSIRDNIEYGKLHVFTRYGVFGFKLWAGVFKNF